MKAPRAPSKKAPELSLLIAFSDCEESVGREIQCAAAHLRALGRPFEIVAVNDGSKDNSVAVLQLLGASVPEMRLICRDCTGRAFARAVAEARGALFVLASCSGRAGLGPWAGLGWGLSRLQAGHEAVVFRSRYILARRQSCAGRLSKLRGSSVPYVRFERAFEREAFDLAVAVVGGTRMRHRPNVARALFSLAEARQVTRPASTSSFSSSSSPALSALPSSARAVSDLIWASVRRLAMASRQ